MIHSFDTAGGPFADPAVVPLSWEVSDPNGDDLTCRLDTDGDGSWELVLSPCQAAGSRNASVGEGARTATLEVSDGEHSVTATTDHSVTAGPTETYDIDARLVSASDAALQAAIDEAVGRWEAVLARGVPDEVVTMASGCLFAPGIDELVDTIGDRLRSQRPVVELHIPWSRGDVIASVHEHGEVLTEVSEAERMVMRARLPDAQRGRFAEFDPSLAVGG